MSTNDVNEHAQLAVSKDALEQQHGQVWDEAELQQDFESVVVCPAAYVVRRRADNVAGKISCQDSPRYYFNFLPQ